MGVLCLSLFCCALLCVLSSFAITLKRKRELVDFATVNVTIFHGVVGWFALCDCSIPWSYSLTFFASANRGQLDDFFSSDYL